MTTFRAPKGTEDILPPDSDWWRRAYRVFDDLCEQFGYGMTLLPLFEDTDVFARGVGGDTEVVEKQMYTFTDKGGRSVTLRPEATASMVRALIQSGGVQTRFKGAFWGPMFRYERPQKGRNRQFYQGDIEYIGTSSPEADVEVIEFGWRYLQRMGLTDVELRLNSIGDAEDRADYRREIQAFLHERFDALSPDAQRRIDSNPMRVLDSKADRDVVADAPVPVDHLGEEAGEHFADVRTGLDNLDIPYVIDARLVRGLDYYNRTVWEYVPRTYDAAQSSVGGGGRYDGLFEILGGKPTPGVGLALGIDRIGLALGAHEATPALDGFIIAARDGDRSAARKLTSELRSAGLRVDMTDRPRPVKAQFKEADRSGAAAAIVVGEEWDAGMVSVKQLETGEQQEVAVEEIEAWLRS
ncbi:MAG: histidine--tRNA ligase [Acidimicrobiia bacterium]|nr:histidine--tRNA ligase [Acidimicrobiia bacterium]